MILMSLLDLQIFKIVLCLMQNILGQMGRNSMCIADSIDFGIG